MYRSWAYILMVVATLAGVVALLWPAPPLRTIADLATDARPVAKAEAPAKPIKAGSKAGQGVKASAPAKPTPPPPVAAAVAKKVPAPTTLGHRAGPVLQNGLEHDMFGKPIETGTAPGSPAAGAPIPPRPPGSAMKALPPRPAPSAPKGPREPAGK